MIELRHITKEFSTKKGPFLALDDVSLTVRDGEIYGIIGLSGAGKSTLVRCVNLLERPTRGQVFLDGEELTAVGGRRLREVRKNIGMIFQNFNLLEQRTAEANVLFPLELAGVKREEARRRAGELLSLVGLAEKAKSYPSQLSGGQKQRVAIARALATNPAYLLCDEATSALDPSTTVSILDLLQRINRDMGVTILVITHEMRVVERICDRVAVLDGGKVAEEGTVAEVFSLPKSEIAKKLVLPNLTRAAERAEGRVWRLVFNGQTSDTPLISALAIRKGIAVNVLYADARELGGKTFGHMLVGLPREGDAETLAAFCRERGVECREEAV